MSTSYRISQEINAQVILWAIAGAIYTACCALGRLYAAVTSASARRLLLVALAYVAGSAVIGAGFLAIFAVVALIPPTAFVGAAIITILAYATYPR